MSILCPNKKIRKEIRAGLRMEKYKKTNAIDVPKHLQKYVWLDIRGKNNRIKIGSVSFGATKQLHIVINGSDNEVVIDDGVHIRSLAITIGESGASPKAHHTRVHIGEKCTFAKTSIFTSHSNTEIEIGARCMFSSNVYIRHTDSHPIYELNGKHHINHVEKLKIGDHVWVGIGVNILKNVQIADDCILGAHAVIAKSFSEAHCAIAGNPAKIIRRGITWNPEHTVDFIENKRYSTDVSELK